MAFNAQKSKKYQFWGFFKSSGTVLITPAFGQSKKTVQKPLFTFLLLSLTFHA